MSDGSKYTQLLLGLLVIILLMNKAGSSELQIAPTSLDISDVPGEGLGPQDNFIAAYITHVPITITANANFSDYDFPGSGTLGDPYKIEGYNITTTVTCILIQNTDAYFVIQDCLLTGGTSSIGIVLSGVSYGEIRNNTITQKKYGVYLDYSSNNTLANNTISGNSYYGVELWHSSNNTLVTNNIAENMYGVYQANSSNNTLANNTISGNKYYSVQLVYSSNNSLVNNTMSGSSYYGVGLQSSRNNIVENNTISGNSYYGVGLQSSRNNIVENNTISGNSQYGVKLLYSSNNTLVNNTMSGISQYGVYLDSSSNNMLSSNIMVNNGLRINGSQVEYWMHNITADNLVNGKQLGYFWSWTSGTIDGSQYGQINLANCTDVTVEDGVFKNASVGIELGYSSYCSLMNNTISGSSQYGVGLDFSSNNTLANNTISGNSAGVFLYSTSKNNLIYLNIIAYSDNRNAYDYGSNNYWNYTSIGNYWSDYAGIGVYSIFGSASSVDYHPFIYPPDTTLPTIDQPTDMNYEEGTTGYTIVWTPSDTNPSHYVVYRNGIEVASGPWDGSSIIVAVDGLSVGVYNYTIVVYDTSGNWVSDTNLVIVLPHTTTTTTTSEDMIGLFIVFVGVVGIEVILVVLILMRFRRK